MNRIALTPDEQADVSRKPFAWSYISAETLHVPSQLTLGYQVVSEIHYLALHDLVLVDGEVRCDGEVARRQLDCRNRMTFIPAGCKVDGWGSTGPRDNRITALFYDRNFVETELEGRIGDSAGPPLLYFQDASLRVTLEKIQSLTERPSANSELYAEILSLLAAIELDRLQKARAHLPIPRSGRLSEAQERLVRDFIMDNIHRSVGLVELANLVNLSRFHLLRAFKKSLGVTPYRYMLERRVERAKELLSRTDTPISTISELCGFGAFAHFSATFRRMTGSTPSQFRGAARAPAR